MGICCVLTWTSPHSCHTSGSVMEVLRRQDKHQTSVASLPGRMGLTISEGVKDTDAQGCFPW